MYQSCDIDFVCDITTPSISKCVSKETMRCQSKVGVMIQVGF